MDNKYEQPIEILHVALVSSSDEYFVEEMPGINLDLRSYFNDMRVETVKSLVETAYCLELIYKSGTVRKIPYTAIKHWTTSRLEVLPKEKRMYG